MNKGIFVGIFLVFLVALSMSVSALTSVNSVVSDDSWTDSSAPGSLDNNDSVLLGVRHDSTEGDGGDIRNTFIRFNLDADLFQDGVVIESATLMLNQYENPRVVREHVIRRILNSWDENFVTWNNSPNVSSIESDRVMITNFSLKAFWQEFDVTSDVQGFIAEDYENYGWMIEDEVDTDGEKIVRYRSSDYDGNISERPMLVVEYSIVEPNLVDVTDLLDLLSVWGACPEGENATECGWDLDSGGDVDNIDLSILLEMWEEDLNPALMSSADLNEDESVNVADLLILLGNWGCEGDCIGDIYQDEIVNEIDLIILLDSWGELNDIGLSFALSFLGEEGIEDLVDIEDLLGLMSLWGECSGENESVCEHDFNGDGNISSVDLDILLALWGEEANVTFGNPDVNGDEMIDVSDLLKVLSDWGLCLETNDTCSSDVLIDGIVNEIDLKIVLASFGQGEIIIEEPEFIDSDDILALLSFFGECDSGDCEKYDFNSDNNIDEKDLEVLKVLFGKTWQEVDERFLQTYGPDKDGNGNVDVEDLLDLLSNWGECETGENATECGWDLYKDDTVDNIDLQVLLAFWGTADEEEIITPVDNNNNNNGGGGGGSSRRNVVPEDTGICLTEWLCEEWSECVNGEQTRTCEKAIVEGFEDLSLCYAGPVELTQACGETLEEESNGAFSFITGAFIGPDGKPNVAGILGFLAFILIAYFVVGAMRAKTGTGAEGKNTEKTSSKKPEVKKE